MSFQKQLFLMTIMMKGCLYQYIIHYVQLNTNLRKIILMPKTIILILNRLVLLEIYKKKIKRKIYLN